MVPVWRKWSAHAAEVQATHRLQDRRAFACLRAVDSNRACLRALAVQPQQGAACCAPTTERSQNRRQDADATKIYSTGATSSSRTSTKWPAMAAAAAIDRKSTRLNSSH